MEVTAQSGKFFICLKHYQGQTIFIFYCYFLCSQIWFDSINWFDKPKIFMDRLNDKAVDIKQFNYHGDLDQN